MLDFIKNKTVFANKYHTHSEAIVVSCFFNPQNSPYRIKAFKLWYETIKHLNHSIIECVIGDAQPQLEESANIKRIYTENLLWHKETLLNKIIAELPLKYKYIFWIDADVLFTNLNWMVDGVKELQVNNIVQPFEYCVHLEKDEINPSFSMDEFKTNYFPNLKNNKVWRSFCANVATSNLWNDQNYNIHGHVGFAWGARREVLEAVPLYDKALIGGADHIIAHAAAGQIAHSCITKSFSDNLDEVNQWSEDFYKVVDGKIGFVEGDLYHIWHGDISKRQYLKRIQDFTSKTKSIVNRDSNGLFIANKDDNDYMENYFKQREVSNNDSLLNSIIVGSIIGDILNDDKPTQEPQTFGGGDFGGSGAGDDWSNENNVSDNSISTNVFDTFS